MQMTTRIRTTIRSSSSSSRRRCSSSSINVVTAAAIAVVAFHQWMIPQSPVGYFSGGGGGDSNHHMMAVAAAFTTTTTTSIPSSTPSFLSRRTTTTTSHNRINNNNNNGNKNKNSRKCHIVQQPQQQLLFLSSSNSNDVSVILPSSRSNTNHGNQHGTNSCFLPLQQLEQDTYMPRIIYIVNGMYTNTAGGNTGSSSSDGSDLPPMTVENIVSTPSVADNIPPALGQWTYTFAPTASDSIDDSCCSISLEGSAIVSSCLDPIIVIAEHSALQIKLPTIIIEPVDVLVLIDRSKTYFKERKFLLYSYNNDNRVYIAAFHTRDELPPDTTTIWGHVEQVTIPWLPAMTPTKTGFLEADEYY